MGIVKFSKEFITSTGLKEWVSLEWDVDVPFDGDKAMGIFEKVKEFVMNSLSMPDSLIVYDPTMIPEIQVCENNPYKSYGNLVTDILSCNDIVTIDSYRLIVSVKGYEKEKEAYDKRRAEIVKQESQEIIDKADALLPTSGKTKIDKKYYGKAL